jgi:D-alanyl-D-alanine carboxypeptidase
LILAWGLAMTVSMSIGPAAAGARRLDIGAEVQALVRMPDGPPGVLALVQRGGRRSVYTAGARDIHTGRAVKPSDYMRLASTAKAFSGAVALALVSRGKLSLDATIGRLLPWLPRSWSRVTLAQALRHTAGLPDFTRSHGYEKAVISHPHRRPSPRSLLRFVTKGKLKFTPGTRYMYSNTDNFIVALMAEAATKTNYNRLLARYVYRPLGLKRTSLPAGPSLRQPYLHGYQVLPDNPRDEVSTAISAAYFWASGGLVSTPTELNLFARGYVGAKLFGRATQAAQMRRFVAGASEPIGPGANASGLGVFRYRTRCGTVYGHTGSLPGYTQFFAATRDGSRSVTVSASEQLDQRSKGNLRPVFRRLRAIEEDAVCLALRR